MSGREQCVLGGDLDFFQGVSLAHKLDSKEDRDPVGEACWTSASRGRLVILC